MNHVTRIGVAIATTCLALASPAMAQSASDDARFAAAQQRFANELQVFRAEFDRYQASHGSRGPGGYSSPRGGYERDGYRRDDDRGYDDDRDEGNYDPSRYYRAGPNYQERTLSTNDRVYAGEDGRYYCKRNDGTTGLIVGGLGGAAAGNIIDGGHSRAVGTLLGGAIGALAGKAVDQNSSQVRCR